MNTLGCVMREVDRVFQVEIAVLEQVRASVGIEYAHACDLLMKRNGKIIITGMGKSALIGRKIAATFVSTGTRAVFLHAVDSLHGDVGIVEGNDSVIAISKSGETEGLTSIVTYLKGLSLPIISITANPDSSLSKLSDLVLHTPIDREACPLDLAPTSSTTAALVVGDALAAALMNLKGFTREDFGEFHPSGNLGARLLLTTENVMRLGEANPTIKVNSSIPDLLFVISNKLCGAVSVVDDAGLLLGLVTDFDIRKNLEQFQDVFSLTIENIMNTNPVFVYSDILALEAKRVMSERDRPVVVLPVLNRQSNMVTGMLHIQDLVSIGL